MALAERLQRPRHHELVKRCLRADPDLAAEPVRPARQHRPGAFEFGQHADAVPVELVREGLGRHPMRVAAEQLHIVMRFQPLDLLADRGLDDMQPAGRARDAAFFIKRDEAAYLAYVHAGHRNGE